MYSTIFAAHPTVIKHPTPQPKSLGVNPETAKAFALSGEASALAEKMAKGSYSVPVKLESAREGSEEEKGNFESPNFVQNKEILKNEREKLLKENMESKNPQKFLKTSFDKDVDMLLSNLENKKDKAERIETRKIL